MTSAEKSIFLVALRDEWVTLAAIPEDMHALIAFGTIGDAEKFASDAAVQQSAPVALYRIVEYRFSGNVSEG